MPQYSIKINQIKNLIKSSRIVELKGIKLAYASTATIGPNGKFHVIPTAKNIWTLTKPTSGFIIIDEIQYQIKSYNIELTKKDYIEAWYEVSSEKDPETKRLITFTGMQQGDGSPNVMLDYQTFYKESLKESPNVSSKYITEQQLSVSHIQPSNGDNLPWSMANFMGKPILKAQTYAEHQGCFSSWEEFNQFAIDCCGCCSGSGVQCSGGTILAEQTGINNPDTYGWQPSFTLLPTSSSGAPCSGWAVFKTEIDDMPQTGYNSFQVGLPPGTSEVTAYYQWYVILSTSSDPVTDNFSGYLTRDSVITLLSINTDNQNVQTSEALTPGQNYNYDIQLWTSDAAPTQQYDFILYVWYLY